MKHIIFSICLFFLMTIPTSIFAEDGYFSCGSDPASLSGKVYGDLTIYPGNCNTEDVLFENVIVTGTVIFDAGESHMNDLSFFFSGSSLNRVKVACPDGHHCELGLDGSTTLNELELYPSGNGSITVNGLIPDSSPQPAFYDKGYLCEGQPEFAAYAGAETSIDFQLQDLETFADIGKIDTIRIYAAEDTVVTFDNVWMHRAFIVPAGNRIPQHFTVNTKGSTFIDLLDSGISFGLHNQNDTHLPHETSIACSYVAGDQMNIGLLLLHSDGDLAVSMDRQYIDYAVFFGAGCDRSTLTLDAYASTSHASDIFQVYVYDANAEFYTKSIRGVYFLIAPDEAPYEAFYRYFYKAETLTRGHSDDFVDLEMLQYLPDADSAYWDRIDAALVWSQLMPYYNIAPAGEATDRISHVYDRSEPNVPYIYYHAAYIDKVRVLSAYGSSDGQLPDYIKQKNWASPNPFFDNGKVRLCENGGCGFNHSMSIGTISFSTSLRDFFPE